MTSPPRNSKVDSIGKYDHYDFPTTALTNQTGHAGHTTPEQDAKVHQLRMKLGGNGYSVRLDTLTLLRFLRAQKFDVQLAEKMFVECEQWRKEINLDDLVQNFKYTKKLELSKYYPQYYHKTDNDGRPLYIEQLGNINLTEMYKITTAERMLQNLAVEYEKVGDPRLPACSRKASHLVETSCSIMDLNGVELLPERLGKLYLINAPWGFSTIFGIVKGWMDPVTVEKIHILGGNYQKELLAQVPAENLPKIFGGDCQCPGGCAWSDEGPWQDPAFAKTAGPGGVEEKKPIADIDNTNPGVVNVASK
ncbi:CRAL-TRIO domain-containing protein [Cadophora sp. MPI-SDFR-AT-0126]|nr:CRAL-TRIO domain-containing protein [Leotiomycetes sp. MPI-SDFR-AT-0126]